MDRITDYLKSTGGFAHMKELGKSNLPPDGCLATGGRQNREAESGMA
jgi:hypothetical protein